jgi:HEPN domain-containing protein
MNADRASDALRWLAFAMGDLAAARSQPGRRVRPRIVAFHAQQAAEKALKAALAVDCQPIPRTHDLDDLRNRLGPGWRVRRRHPDLTRLSDYGVDSRYPDDVEAITPIQCATAVRQASSIVRLVTEDLERRGIATAGLEPR